MKLILNIKSILLFSILFLGLSTFSFGQIYEGISTTEANELIINNIDNPNFVILDVRTPGEHNPQHLEGAILRNYYDSDFEDQLNALDKSKKYLIHCKTGGRSGVTLGTMEDLNFDEVYDMLGGITQWNNQSLPTTSAFAPRIMFVSSSDFSNEIINIGEIDTINITLTNRANDVLTFNSVSSISNPEFTHNFDLGTALTGSEDYTFQIFYEPTDISTDNLSFDIESNDATVTVNIERSGTNLVSIKNTNLLAINVFPNPSMDFIQIDNLFETKASISIFGTDGKLYLSKDIEANEIINVRELKSGLYFIRINTREKEGWTTIVKE